MLFSSYLLITDTGTHYVPTALNLNFYKWKDNHKNQIRVVNTLHKIFLLLLASSNAFFYIHRCLMEIAMWRCISIGILHNQMQSIVV